MMSKKSPQLRFEGFTDDWEERKLGEEFKKVSERNDGSFGRNHWISVAKMYFQSPEKVQSNNIDTRTYVMREGDIAFEGHPNSEFKFGRFVANDIGAGVVSELFPIYKHQHEYDNNYWKNAIQIERIMAPIFAKSITSSGNSSNKLDTKHFLRQKILIPQINEQKKMGSFFKQLDNTIALHQRKLDLLKEQKKGYLQKMFPKNGEKVPELRFAGFADDWEERKLGELASFSKGNGYTKNDLVEFGDPIILYGRLYTKYETVIEKVDTFVNKKDNSIISEGSEVIVPASGESSEDISRASVVGKSGLILGGDLNIIKPVNYIDSIFLALTISNGSQRQEMSKRAQGKSVVHLHNSDLKQVNLLYPKLEEQQKIGTFFKQLDCAIALHQHKLDLLKEQKKGFLQKMFV
mgnify:CR=1 FL=1